MARMRGGENLEKRLAQIARSVVNASTVRVGFLEGATYPDGKPVAMIAMIQDFGAPSVGIPPRPFFRNMIAAKQGEWPAAIAGLLRDNAYDARVALSIAGAAIAGQLRQSLIDTNAPPNVPSTIRKKGHAKPLVDTGHMIQSIDFEVTGG